YINPFPSPGGRGGPPAGRGGGAPNPRAPPALCEDANAIGSRLEQAADWCVGALDEAGRLGAYLLAHPWAGSAPPSWNQALPALPDARAGLYLHDLALGPAARGQGLAGRLVDALLAQARAAGCPQAHLVAVQDSVGFWSRQGFAVLAASASVAASYGADARLMGRAL
ncbi:MAG: GNAT family N-acetyltransferase, partial [Moraxellaceae bacterium]